MYSEEIAAEIEILESKINLQNTLLDNALSEKLELSKTRSIFHELKELTDRLKLIKSGHMR